MPNFNAVSSTLYASKIKVNQLVIKLSDEHGQATIFVRGPHCVKSLGPIEVKKPSFKLKNYLCGPDMASGRMLQPLLYNIDEIGPRLVCPANLYYL